MQRKEFIKTCSGLCLAGVAGSVLLQSCASANYFAKHNEVENKITIAKTEFTGTNAGKTFVRKYILISTDSLQTPVCVYRHSETEYTALLMLCTHQGCELTVSGQMLNCPCHGSDFDSYGVVLNPPADKNLTSYKVTTDDQNITIYLS